jgi:hypothetical protein
MRHRELVSFLAYHCDAQVAAEASNCLRKREILQKALHHPQGFLSFKLFDSRAIRVALHIWTGEGRQTAGPLIHSHDDALVSLVAMGALLHETYAVATDDSGPLEACSASYSRTFSRVSRSATFVTADRVAKSVVAVGQDYSLAPGCFHQVSQASPSTVATLCVSRIGARLPQYVLMPRSPNVTAEIRRLPRVTEKEMKIAAQAIADLSDA